jgi:type VI secretion system protein ImpF
MADPRIIDGAPTLLFERLIDLDPKGPADPRSLRVLTTEDLRASIGRELERLLDTRRPVSLETAIGQEQVTVRDYGIADWSSLSAQRTQDRQTLATVIRRAILAFEPRLKQPTVTVAQVVGQPGTLRVNISGTMVYGSIMEPVSFPIDLRGSSRT